MLGHEPEAMDEGGTINRAGMDQVREIFSFHDTNIFQPRNGVVSQHERPLFDSRKPSLKT